MVFFVLYSQITLFSIRSLPIAVISAQVGLTRLEALKYRKLVMFAIAKL